MSTYVMSDLHGCYDLFMKMLEVINFNENDTLILAGDYVDRGNGVYKLLEYLMNRPDNMILLMGNHDEEFVERVRIMELINIKENINVDPDSYDDFSKLYFDMDRLLEKYNPGLAEYFDYYGTFEEIIFEKEGGVTLRKASKWKEMLEGLSYVYKTEINNQEFIMVHAGYAENLEQLKGYKKYSYEHMEDFYIHARSEAYEFGGKKDAIIVAGHTPTLIGDFCYNNGKIYREYNEKLNCTFYNVDCGAVFCEEDENAHLACLRLDDLKEFYVR